jgi:hypothetical protein
MEQEQKTGAASMLVRSMTNRTVLVLFQHLGDKISTLASKFKARLFFPADGEDWKVTVHYIFDGVGGLHGVIEAYPGYARAQQDIASILTLLVQIKSYAASGSPSLWDNVWTSMQDHHEAYLVGLRSRLKDLTDEVAWVSKLIEAEQQQYGSGKSAIAALHETDYGFSEAEPEDVLARLLRPYPDLVEFLQTKGQDYADSVVSSIEGEQNDRG